MKRSKNYINELIYHIYIMRIFIFIFFISNFLPAQTVYYSQGFETSNIISIVNTFADETIKEAILTEGPPPCGFASRGNTLTHNSLNVDFDVAENSTSFAGTNPEICGGYFESYLKTTTFDMSSATSQAYFSFRYFKSTTIGWGGSAQIEVKNDTNSYLIDNDQLSLVTDRWETVEFLLPTTLNTTNVYIFITLTAGEAMVIDDIRISDSSTLSVSEYNTRENILISPNPSSNVLEIVNVKDVLFNKIILLNINGQLISTYSNKTKRINISNLANGVYFLKIQTEKSVQTLRFIKI